MASLKYSAAAHNGGQNSNGGGNTGPDNKGRNKRKPTTGSIKTIKEGPAPLPHERETKEMLAVDDEERNDARSDLLREKQQQLKGLTEKRAEFDNQEKMETHRIFTGLSREEIKIVCFNDWAEDEKYNREMLEHFDAIELGFRILLKLQNVDYWRENPIIDDSLIDFSIGPGEVQKRWRRHLSDDAASNMFIHGNDPAEVMLRYAEDLKKMYGSVKLTPHDMTRMRLYRKYKTALICQSMAFQDDKQAPISKALEATEEGGIMLLIDDEHDQLTIPSSTSTISKEVLFGEEFKICKPLSFDKLRRLHITQGRVEFQFSIPVIIPGLEPHDMVYLGVRKGTKPGFIYPEIQDAVKMLLQALFEVNMLNNDMADMLFASDIKEFCRRGERRESRKKKKRNRVHMQLQDIENPSRRRTLSYPFEAMTLGSARNYQFGSLGHVKDFLILNQVVKMLGHDQEAYRQLKKRVRPGGYIAVIDNWSRGMEGFSSFDGIGRMAARTYFERSQDKTPGMKMVIELWIPTSENEGVCLMVFKKPIR